jgi:hypothetical protein
VLCRLLLGAAGDAAAGAAAADGDADEEAPAKFTPELKVNEDVWNVLFNNKAKLFIRVKKDSGATDWENRGVGLLTVRQAKQGDNSGKTYIYFSTDVVSGGHITYGLGALRKQACLYGSQGSAGVSILAR